MNFWAFILAKAMMVPNRETIMKVKLASVGPDQINENTPDGGLFVLVDK